MGVSSRGEGDVAVRNSCPDGRPGCPLRLIRREVGAVAEPAMAEDMPGVADSHVEKGRWCGW
jgi:hypothetical protein